MVLANSAQTWDTLIAGGDYFPNRLGKNTFVYLGSAELSAICSKLGRIPTKAEYLTDVGVINQDSANVYKYMNFDQMEEFDAKAVAA